MRRGRGAGDSGVSRGADVRFVFFGEAAAYRRRGTADSDRHFFTEGVKGAYIMKIVVLKSPRLLGGILRMMFGIKKANYPQG